MGRYAQKMYGNRDVKLFVSVFDNFVGTVGYLGNFANDPGQIMYPPPPAVSDNNNTRFGYRQPIRLPDGVPDDPPVGFWFSQGTGDPVEEQSKVDEQILMLANAGVYGVILLYYPQTEHVTSSPTATPPRDPWSKFLWQWAKYYFTSAYKSRLKYYVMCTSLQASYDVNTVNADQEFTSPGTYLNLPNFAAYWAELMTDPDYEKDANGVPFFALYDATDMWTVPHRDEITAAALLEGFTGVHYVQPNQNQAQAALLGADLGGYNNGISIGTQSSYDDQIAKDRSYWAHGVNQLNKQLAIAHMDDGRVARGVGTWWTDHATYTEAETHLLRSFDFVRASRKIVDQIATLYSGGEMAEAGEFFPTRQTILLGPNAPSRGVWLDAIRNVVFRTLPSSYTDVYHAMALAPDITRTGAGWSTANTVTGGGGSNPGAYQFQEHRNTTPGDTIEIAPSLPCTGIRIYGRRGVGFGTSNVQTDGGAPTLLDQAALSNEFNVLLYDTGLLPLALHSVLATVVTGISFDQFRVDVVR